MTGDEGRRFNDAYPASGQKNNSLEREFNINRPNNRQHISIITIATYCTGKNRKDNLADNS